MRTTAGLACLATSAQLAGLAVEVGVGLGDSAVDVGGADAVTVTVAGWAWLEAPPSRGVPAGASGSFAEQAAVEPQRATTPATTRWRARMVPPSQDHVRS
ncbi:hypothetical protein GCM10009721_11850 [Terrabacter tumescens]|uniref:Secreted protein n=1 Tax=Terrabacter tumescens TaxID=60443 RepID=A0ABQ2HQ66_9MICO|nr:hypothetical protein GCM10009721_11850 [Terrabacter tumescens]